MVLLLLSFTSESVNERGIYMRNNSKKLVFASLLVAMSVVITRLFYFPIPTISGGKIIPYYGYFVIMFAGFLLGPSYGAAVGGVSDILGFFINPQGAFFPGFTLTSILVGLIPGLFYKKAKNNIFIFILIIIFTAIIESTTTTLWVSMLYGSIFRFVIFPRLITGLIIWTIQGILVFSLLKATKNTGIKI
jgi:ECF transporter S component (folate family)